jgi:hypothetical protein
VGQTEHTLCLRTEPEFSLLNVVLNKNMAMDNFQIVSRYINMPLSQTFSSDFLLTFNFI